MADLFVLFILLILIASFSAAETSFVAADKISVIVRHGKGEIARSTFFFLQNGEIFFATVVVAGNLFISIFSSISESFFHERLGIALSYVIPATTAVGFLFGELVPKTVALEGAESSARFLLPMVKGFYSLTRPLVRFTATVSSFIAARVFRSESQAAVFQRRDVYRFLSESASEGYLDKIESDIIRKFLTKAGLLVKDIAVPRTQIVAVKRGTRIPRLIDVFLKTGKSKVAVFDSSIDNIVGVVHARDLFKEADIVDGLLSDVLFVPDSITVADLLEEFREERVYVAILIDEFGGTSGFVSSSDVLEVFLGDVAIWTNEVKIKPIGGRQYILSGNAEIPEIEETLRIKLPRGEYSTVAGMIMAESGRIPREGEKVYVRGMEFVVTKSDGRKLDTLKVTLR